MILLVFGGMAIFGYSKLNKLLNKDAAAQGEWRKKYWVKT